ncbi:thioredoxin TrxA [Buchnera aphidicola str. APS (Acyrthosiphon pisum)]|uniref:Thioredoxin n=2 Tax=Buchnera aphidicola TaxID=9 RepID=THIO_BUCAI|nr:thioredoxin TrxA [Buchnera aphidicola]P57653.1 RecName: Full=Thioredoxin; Short=Trx [Buchnera aphidicola str. APS (Acyrthosiphon pisum)]pir/B84999/ thioredoxin [imported] - Buchnera sp. (strain APS) [Buchnera sp. (in: enterobacteria)]ADP66972.1 thioredoxin [Buchnera aphidicola str. TLW03 (Acyrthosiphon pisum)]ACL30377.1 thioredoxin [Buchnera aphidicola str. Tuc7 (Acyrthosiphon pisum)]ACL30931.1 thioredoxin [Buchnera aphidicola str. 5A (Acyrthosiphon pisum)]ADP66399.1 thioredoxin [Buchnera 
MNKIIELTDQNFEEQVLNSKSFFLVDFWAQWCNPCKILAPILEEISKEYSNKVIVGKLNIEENPNTAPVYSIRSIPTLLLFNNSEVLATKVGAVSKLELKEFLDENIN